MIKGTEKSITVFKEDGYTSTTDMGKTEWYYKNINAMNWINSENMKKGLEKIKHLNIYL